MDREQLREMLSYWEISYTTQNDIPCVFGGSAGKQVELKENISDKAIVGLACIIKEMLDGKEDEKVDR